MLRKPQKDPTCMYVEVQARSYWKTEHKDQAHCQDAYAHDPAHGLFVIADGAGTTLYPALWSRILVEHFEKVPLGSNQPFEVEWWLRQAQRQYRQDMLQANKPQEWNPQLKALQGGSASTLASLRLTRIASPAIEACLLVYGDSCIFIGHAKTQQVESFSYTQPQQFERGPICLPSELRDFQRHFQNGEQKDSVFEVEDVVLLATDAVSKWILSQGNQQYSSCWEALQVVCKRQTQEEWISFIEECRATQQMIDDDCTAITLRFHESNKGDSHLAEVGVTERHTSDVLQSRVQEFEQARQEENKELLAVIYGDGVDLKACGIQLSEQEIQAYRQVADAFQHVLVVMQQTKNTPAFVTRVREVWHKYQDILINEPCAANVRQTLINNHIIQAPHKEDENSAVQTIQQNSGNDEGRKKDLERRLLLYYDDEKNYENFWTVIDEIDQLYDSFNKFYTLKPNMKIRIEYAVKLRDKRTILCESLKKGGLQEIAEHYNADLNPILSKEERDQIRVAQRFSRAMSNDDDDEILQVFTEIGQQPEEIRLLLSKPEEEAVQLARKKVEAYRILRAALQEGNTPDHIINAYDPVLEAYVPYERDGQEQVELAKKFVEAWDQDEIVLLVRTYASIKSKYKNTFAFTSEKTDKISQYRELILQKDFLQHINSSQVLVLVTKTVIPGVSRKITVEDFKEAAAYTNECLQHLISKKQHPADEEPSSALSQWAENVRSCYEKQDYPQYFLLNVLVDTVIIDLQIEDWPKNQREELEKPYGGEQEKKNLFFQEGQFKWPGKKNLKEKNTVLNKLIKVYMFDSYLQKGNQRIKDYLKIAKDAYRISHYYKYFDQIQDYNEWLEDLSKK